MSRTLTLTGKSHELSYDIFPPIELTDDGDYVIGLINFHSYNSIANIDETINKFYYDNKILTLPVGSYEIEDINNYIHLAIGDPNANDVFQVDFEFFTPEIIQSMEGGGERWKIL